MILSAEFLKELEKTLFHFFLRWVCGLGKK